MVKYQFLEIKRSRPLRRNSIQFLASMLKFALRRGMVNATIQARVMMITLLLHSIPSVKRTVARRVSGNKAVLSVVCVYLHF